MTKHTALANQRAYRRRTNNRVDRKYRRTIRGFLVRTYGNMRSRVLGRNKPHLYKGLPLLGKEEFYAWALEDTAFLYLYRRWKESGHELKLAPSVNRINSRVGYTLDNMEWLNYSANSALGAMNKRKSSACAAITRAYQHSLGAV